MQLVSRSNDIFKVIALHVPTNESVEVKVYKSCRKKNVRRQIAVLQHLGRVPCVQRIRDVVRNPKSHNYCLVTDNFDCVSFKLNPKQFTLPLLQKFLRSVLVTLDSVHSRGVIHKNINLDTVLFNPKDGAIELVDFDFAEFYEPEKEYVADASSPNFKAPEELIRYRCLTYAVDVWAVGVLLASIVC